MNEVHHIGKVSKDIKIKRAVWNICCALLFRPFPTGVLWPWRRLLLMMFGAKIHKDSNVYSSVKIWAPWNLKMQRGACLGPNVICYNQDLVWLKEHTTVSQYAYLCTAGHETDEINSADVGLITAGITLYEGAWVGTRAFVGMGVVIGKNAIVGANAGVYKDVEANTIVGGNPAVIIKKRELKK